MSVQLMHGDCLELMNEIPDKSVDMVLCDLPYGVLNKGNPSAKWDNELPLSELWKQWNRVCKETSPVVLFGSGMFTAKLMMSNSKAWKYNLVWKKGERITGFLNANRMPLRNHEDICVFYYKQSVYHPQMEYTGFHVITSRKGDVDKEGTNSCYGSFKSTPAKLTDYRHPRSIINISPEKIYNHPTEKPVKLCEWLIKTYTNEGETVLDNTMGSGSTGVACMNTGRNFIGIELEKKYFDIASKRINDAEKFQQLKMDV